MKQRFKIDDMIYYVDKLSPRGAGILERMPGIAYGRVKCLVADGYQLEDKTVVSEPFVYASAEEAIHGHANALLWYLKDVSEARDAVIAKLEEYGIEGLGLEGGDMDDALYVREQVEYIRLIPEDKRTPEMKALVWAVEHPSVE